VEAQSCDDEFDHATCVVAGVVVRADTEIADATQQFVGIHAGPNLARRGSSVEQLGAHGDKAVEEVGVQGLEGGIVGLQRLGEAEVWTRFWNGARDAAGISWAIDKGVDLQKVRQRAGHGRRVAPPGCRSMSLP
jgi:hypothetical protein